MCQDDVSFKLDTTGGRSAIDRVFVEGSHKWERAQTDYQMKNSTKKEIILGNM